MLRRDTLLVGRVSGKGESVWCRGVMNETLEDLYKGNENLFYMYKSKFYLHFCEETGAVFFDALNDSVLHIIGSNEHEEMREILPSLKAFRDYIADNSVMVGKVRDGEVLWIEDTWALGICKKTMLEQWSRELEHFEVMNNKVYYIKPKQEVIEALYFKCVDMAGSELRLAKSLTRSTVKIEDKRSYRLELMKNIAALRRFNFKQRKSFARYVGLFSAYLKNNGMPTDGLFAPELRDA